MDSLRTGKTGANADRRWTGVGLAILAAALAALVLVAPGPPAAAEPDGWETPLIIDDDWGPADMEQVALNSAGYGVSAWRQWDYTNLTYNIAANTYTASSGWRGGRLIEAENSGNATSPIVAVDGPGNAVVVWEQFDGTGWRLMANRFVLGIGWQTARHIDNGGTGVATDSKQLVVGPGGAAFVVWEQWSGFQWRVWTIRYTPGAGWGTAEALSGSGAVSATAIQAGVDGYGNVFAVWSESNGSGESVWANRYSIESGWGSAKPLETNLSGSSTGPVVAVEPDGNAVVVWERFDGTSTAIWGNRYVLGEGWGSATPVEAYSSYDSTRPTVAVDSGGNAFVLWYEWDGANYSLWSNRRAAGSGWQTPTLIDPTIGRFALGATLTVSPGGDGIVVWRTWAGVRFDLWARVYEAKDGWLSAEIIDPGVGNLDMPFVAVDQGGNATVVWNQYNASVPDIYSNRYVAGSGWGQAKVIDTHGWNAWDPVLAGDRWGNALAIWRHAAGTKSEVWAAWFSVEDTRPPTVNVTNPNDGMYTNESSVWVVGVTEPGAALSVNGLDAHVQTGGQFALLVSLIPRLNVIQLTATDAAGNSQIVVVHVIYVDPLPPLLERLNETEANFSAAMADLAALEATGNATRQDLDQARAQWDAALGELEAARAEIAVLSGLVNETSDDLQLAKARLAVAEQQLLDARIRIELLSASSNQTAADLQQVAADLEAAEGGLEAAEAAAAIAEANIRDTQQQVHTAKAEAAGAQGAAMVALLVGLAGLVVGGLAVVLSRLPSRAGGTGRSTGAGPSPRGEVSAREPPPSQESKGPKDPDATSKQLAPCPKCGKEVSIGASQCAECGLELTWD